LVTTYYTGMDSKFFHTDILNDEPLSKLSWILIIATIIYQLLYVWQGLDFTDTGFHLTAYQQIFDNPYTVHYSFMFWLSNIFGGAIMKFFPGLLANRIASVLLHTAMFWLYYDLVRRITGRNKAIIYCSLSLLFFQYYGFETLNYDSFSIASMSLVVYFFVRGLWSNTIWQFALGAFICGAATYFRVTNLAAVSFIPLAGIWLYLLDKDIAKTVKTTLLMTTSYIGGHAIIIALMMVMAHWDLFLSNIDFVGNMGTAGDSSHGFLPVMLLYAKGWVKIGLFVSMLVMIYYLRGLTRSFISTELLQGLSLFALGFALFFIYQYPTATWSKLRYLLYASTLISTVFLLWKGDNKMSILASMAFVMVVIFPLGSDSGIEKLYFSCGLSLALLFYVIDKLWEEEQFATFKQMGAVLYITTCLCFGFTNTYFDLGSRLQKTATTSHPALSHIYTTAERAATIDSLLIELNKHVSKGDYLLAFSDIPMINYLTETKPCIGTSWPKLYYAPSIFETELNHGYNKSQPSAVVMQKMEMRSAWPTNDTPDYLDLSMTKGGIHPENRLPEHYAIMLQFLEGKYDLVWESSTFRVYVPITK